MCKMKFEILLVLSLYIIDKTIVRTDDQCQPAVVSSTGWLVECPTYSVERGPQSDVTVVCVGYQPINTNDLFANMSIAGVTSYTFSNCPPPDVSFGEILVGQIVAELVFVVQNRVVRFTSNIFQDLPYLEKLNIDCGKLNALPNGVFANLQSLRSLTLNAYVRSLQSGIFDDLTSLLELIILGNPLISLPDNVFNRLHNLKRLVLSKGLFKSFPEDTFSLLVNLQDLSLKNNAILDITKIHLQTLRKLTIFDISSNRLRHLDRNLFQGNLNLSEIDISFNSRIGTIPNDLLRNLNLLETLNIRDCNITEIADDFFSFAPNLQTIIMDNNRLKGISSRLFYGIARLQVLNMPFNDVVDIAEDAFGGSPDLRTLNLGMNNMRRLPAALFTNNPNLQVIDMDGTYLQDLPSDLFNNLNHLKALNFRNNLLTFLNGRTPFGNSSSELNYIDFSYNNIADISGINWEAYPALKDFNMNYNVIANFSLPVLKSTDTIMRVRNNYMRMVFIDEFEKSNKFAVAGSNIVSTTFELKNNKFTCDCNLLKFAQLLKETLSHFNPKERNAVFIESDTYTCGRPLELNNKKVMLLNKRNFVCNFSDSCPSFCNCYYRAVDRTVEVECSNKGLAEIPSLLPKNTKKLNANHNSFQTLEGLENSALTFLDVSFNKILSGDWKLPENLTELRLNNNQLTWVPPSLFELALKEDSRIFLSGNDFACGCDFQKLKEILSRKNANSTDVKRVKCGYSLTLSKRCT